MNQDPQERYYYLQMVPKILAFLLENTLNGVYTCTIF